MFSIFKKAFSKTSEKIAQEVDHKRKIIDKDLLETILLEADVLYDVVEDMLDSMPSKINRVQAYNSMISLFAQNRHRDDAKNAEISTYVEMIVGVNGAGKTTTIAKLAYLYKKEGKSVLIGAADTFRAAAIEQLQRWAKRVQVPIVATRQGHDPSAVVYDAINSAKSKSIQRVIIDTAGRLHTQSNLANELQKMARVASKAIPDAPHRKIMIIDGTQGNSVIAQAKAFDEMIGIDGIIITKLDGTAKGGALMSIQKELNIPILYIGIGESMEDLVTFDAKDFVDGILDEIFV